MEGVSISMDRKTQYCQDVSSSQFDLYIQCIQNPPKLFRGYQQSYSKVYRKAKDHIANTILKKNRVLTLNIKTYDKATVSKTGWYWQKNK